MNKQVIINHGDLILKPSKANPPKDAAKSHVHVLQDSGPTRNRHEAFSDRFNVLRWTKDSKEYVSCAKPYAIRHVGGDCEHGEKPLSGTYEVLHEEEYDPFKNELRRIID